MHIDPQIAELLAALSHPQLPEVDLSLERMHRLLEALGHPERRLPPVIHVAGTNGKGSTLAFLKAMYAAGGYRVHAYISPHLVRFNERIVLNGAEISDARLLSVLATVRRRIETCPATFFEATTAAAFLAFAEQEADVLLLETGLGGRLDATNVVAQPILTVITPIGFDHTEFLGPDLASIAAEKAGIMKPGSPCIVGHQTSEVRVALARKALSAGVPLVAEGIGWRYRYDDAAITVQYDGYRWSLPLPSLSGAHQIHNAALASVVAKACLALPLSDQAMQLGIRSAVWPARLHQLHYGPLVEAWRGCVVVDGAHNAHAAQEIARWVAAQTLPVTLICGMMQRKDAAAFLAPFAGIVAQFLAVPIAGEPCYDPKVLAAIAEDLGIMPATAHAGLAHAMAALPQDNSIVLIAGSLFLAGEVLKNHG